MKENELKPCPFCGSHERPFISSFNDIDAVKWNLNHYCTHTAKEGLSVIIEIYGKSREEVIERWNRRADNEQRAD